jgi:pimeloyl-ACP methyl ester carboxylesterase
MIKNWMLGILGLASYCLVACSALPEDLNQNPAVDQRESANYIQLTPKNNSGTKQTGIIFYPGGLVDPHAYIQPLQELAAAGYPVLIIKATGNLAIFNAGKAKDYREELDVKRWVVGGHSLGGVVAAYDVRIEPEAYAGLFLWASFPGEGGAIPDWEGAVLSLSAEKDGLTLKTDVEENKANLPEPMEVQDLASFPNSSTAGKTIYYEIIGGNHAQFGSYGSQESDGTATISRSQQHDEINAFMLAFLQANQW